MQAAQNPQRDAGLKDFDRAFWGHIRYTIGNGLRSVFHGITAERFAGPGPRVSVEMRSYVRSINRLSAAYAFLADISMLMLGGSLKRKEKLSARLGDILAMMFLASCVIKRYEMEGRIREDADLARWCIEDCLNKIRIAFDGVFDNFPNRLLGRVLKTLLFPWGIPGKSPSDHLGHRIAQLLSNPGDARDRLTPICFIHDSEHDPIGAIEHALNAVIAAEPIDAKIRAAEKQGLFKDEPLANSRDIGSLAAQRGVLNADEVAVLKRRDALRDRVIHVDDFPFGIHEKSAHERAADADAEARLRAA